ncbi:MAG TPA: multidrug effflux MFS transporter [Kineosporiaceae bacterium]|nr:multidrug effflux MFS transporter [Kineosporiaceae bacterium]
MNRDTAPPRQPAPLAGGTGRPAHPRVPLRLLLVLGPLSAFGPLSMDLYLPALPEIARDLHSGDAAAQLTMSACMVGLAVGQLVAGALSDRFGRRKPVLVGVALFAVLSVGCALAPSMPVLIGLRFLQGLAGSAGIVVARAVVRDLYDGAAAARVFSLLMLVLGAAPVLAPVLGGQLVRFVPWPGLFLALAVVGVALLAAAAAGLPETLPPQRRHAGGMGATLRAFGPVLADRRFVGYAAVNSLSFAAMFTYIGQGAFVLQGRYGVSPQQYSAVFAVNAAGIVLAGRAGAVLVGRVPPVRLVLAGIGTAAVAAVVMFGAVASGGLPVLLGGLFVVVACTGLVGPNATALALARHGARAGTASSVLGLCQFLVGAVVAPLSSLGGASATTMTATMAAVLIVGVGVLVPMLRTRRVTT